MSKKNRIKQQAIEKISAKIEKHVEQGKLISFNFKYLTSGKKFGENFEDWEKHGLLVELNNKLKQFSASTPEELRNSKALELYESFPSGSKFEIPKSIVDLNVRWARLRLTGQRRVCGFFLKGDQLYVNTMFIVFLDKNHRFAPCNSE